MRNEDISPHTIIKDSIKLNPRAENVIKKYFGEGCLSCPGLEMETLAYGANLHDVDVEELIKNLKEAHETV